jgi:hypothetical protein
MKPKKVKKAIHKHLHDEYSKEDIKSSIQTSSSIKVIKLIEITYDNGVTEHIRVSSKKIK